MGMIKKSLYPKTKRIADRHNEIVVTEKLDGSNLGFFNFGGELWVAQRNNVYFWRDPEVSSKMMYKGLYGWLEENGSKLLESLQPNSCIFGEWIGMGKISYNSSDIDKRFYQFAKANITCYEGDFSIKNLYYERDLFKYCYINQEMPDFIEPVPVAYLLTEKPTVHQLDGMYDQFVKELGRESEGFIIIDGGAIKKYVRHKNGQLQPHKQG